MDDLKSHDKRPKQGMAMDPKKARKLYNKMKEAQETDGPAERAVRRIMVSSIIKDYPHIINEEYAKFMKDYEDTIDHNERLNLEIIGLKKMLKEHQEAMGSILKYRNESYDKLLDEIITKASTPICGKNMFNGFTTALDRLKDILRLAKKAKE